MNTLRKLAALPVGLLGLALIVIGVMLEQLAEWAAEEHEKRRDKDV